MSRSALLVGALLIALGASVFALKVFRYAIPLTSSEGEGPWQVELRINVRGAGGPGSVRALLPASEAGQQIFDESSTSDQLDFAARDQAGNRVGVWSGVLGEIHEVVFAFRVQSRKVEVPLPEGGPFPSPPRQLAALYLEPTPALPSATDEVRAQLERLALPPVSDLPGRVRTIYAFVANEVATVESASDDALLVLANREGSRAGKERLLVSLLRAGGIPARIVHGLELGEDATPGERTWTEAWLAGAWIPMSSVDGFFAERPENWLVLGRGNVAPVEATAVRAVGHRYRALREHLRPEELANLRTPDNPIFQRLSLYRLPLPTQQALRVLLLIPIGALIVALFRNLIGVKTYGTFMPILISLALRGYPLLRSLGLVALVIGLGLLSRRLLEALRLLMVPRLSVMLCFVVLSVTALALIGDDTQTAEFFAGVLFPMVILTMLVERIFITSAEEGLREALNTAAISVAVASTIHPVFRSARAEYLMFTFPELTLCCMGVLIWIGGYTGYRVSDLLRFRALARGSGIEAA